MKFVIVVGDGMADEPQARLGGRTPLQAAATPNADRIAGAGELGTVLTVPEGVAPGTDTAFFGIMGYDVKTQYTGRSPLEGTAMGIELPNGHTAFRCNLVSVTPGVELINAHMLSHSGGQVGGRKGRDIMAWLNGQPRFSRRLRELDMTLYPGSAYRHIMTLGPKHSEPADAKHLRLTPPHEFLGEKVAAHLPEGGLADLVFEVAALANEILPDHPYNREKAQGEGLQANAVWLWGQGSRPQFMPWAEKFGVSGSVISAVPLVKGIGFLCGLSVVEVEGATGELDTDYDGKADAAIRALKGGDDFALVHVEAPDECSHNGDLFGKVEAVARFDAMLGRILRGLDSLDEGYRLLLLSDHCTMVRTRAHASGAVPYVLYDSGRDEGKVRTYDEKSAFEAGTALESAVRLVPRLLKGG
jgi:2,3-bisphosphoglycerate-independent phosphoglycerate mutase